MHRIRSAIIGLLAVSGLFAGPVAAGDWTSADTEWQAAYLTLLAIDWRQTRWIAKHPENFHEDNPLLGEHPSVARVDSFVAFAAIGHTAISYNLPPDWRRTWQKVTVWTEAAVVGRNFYIGIKLDL